MGGWRERAARGAAEHGSVEKRRERERNPDKRTALGRVLSRKDLREVMKIKKDRQRQRKAAKGKFSRWKNYCTKNSLFGVT